MVDGKKQEGMREMDTLVKRKIKDAEQGKWIYERAIRGVENLSGYNKAVLIFPDNDCHVVDVAMRFLDRFSSEYDFIVIITSQTLNLNFLRESRCFFRIVKLEQNDMDRLLSYASVFGNRTIRIMSLTHPYSQKAKNLVGFKDLSIEKIVCRALYAMVGRIVDGEKEL